MVQNLNCARSSSPNELVFSWELSTVRGNEVAGYQVEVKGLRHKDTAKEVIQFDAADFNTAMKKAFVNEGLGTFWWKYQDVI